MEQLDMLPVPAPAPASPLQELMLMPLGKYKGREISEIATTDPEYLKWLTAQSWFEQRYSHLFQTIITNNYYNEPAETPDHNAMQVRFLDAKYLTGFIKTIKTKEDWQSLFCYYRRAAAHKQIEEIRHCRELVQKGIEHLGSDDPLEFLKTHEQHHYLHGQATSLLSSMLAEERAIKAFQSIRAGHPSFTQVQFEVDGWDVVFGYGRRNKRDKHVKVSDRFLIECKPTLGDDYPAVLRQMVKQEARFAHGDHYWSQDQHLICVVGEYTGRGATWEQVQQIFASKNFKLILERDGG